MNIIIFVISIPDYQSNKLDHHLLVLLSRGFSSVWMVFYGFAAGLINHFKKLTSKDVKII